MELPALAPSRRAKRRGKHTGPEPALRPEKAGSDGRPGAPAWPRQRERFAAVAPASRALSIERSPPPPRHALTLTSTTLHKGRVIHSPSFNLHLPRQVVHCITAADRVTDHQIQAAGFDRILRKPVSVSKIGALLAE